MPVLSRRTPFILLLGDIVSLCASLWLTLFFRYQGIPDATILSDHFYPFSYLFLIWVLVYFIFGLYERQAMVSRARLWHGLVKSQLVNLFAAAVFFYFVTFTSITPKTNLVIFLIISTALILVWRLEIYVLFTGDRRERALLIGNGAETQELYEEVNKGRYNFQFVSSINPSNQDEMPANLVSHVQEKKITLVVVDFHDPRIKPLMAELYMLLVSKVRFADMHEVYADVFDRVALSMVGESWFIRNFSIEKEGVYDVIKRAIDFILSFTVGLVSLIFYPFVWAAIKIEDGGPVFVIQERVGKDGNIIRIPKFRSMRSSDKGIWVKEHDDRITKVGKILRQTRIDELPQLFSVLKGDMSLVGPRPDIRDLGEKLLGEIPYYRLRNVIKPGLSGWAQIRQQTPPQSLEETRVRLAYDFYYIKHRSLGLDLKIAAQTIATLASRVGK